MSEQTFIKGLYLVATPIGNLGDLSARAVDVLKAADLIACEDTRVTAKLLSHWGIATKTTPYHEHNADKALPKLMERLKNGDMIAQVSDAGTPIVSDPGYRLVQACLAENVYVTAVPGASAVLTALQLSGLPSHRWLFEGFLPPKTAAKEKELNLLKEIPATLIFYESPNRLTDTLKSMRAVLGDRQAAVSRELTKKFEETVRGNLDFLIEKYETEGAPKGEIVITVAPAKEKVLKIENIEELLKQSLQTMKVKDAAAFVAEQTGLSKKELYQKALALKNDK